MVRIILAAVLLVGCSSTPTPFIKGDPAPAPSGWVDYCKRNPKDIDCG